jgi:hypothetical protein
LLAVALVAGSVLLVVGIAGLTAGVGLAWAAVMVGILMVGGVVPWLLLSPYLHDEAARVSRGSSAPHRGRGSLGFLPELIERGTREMGAGSDAERSSSSAEPTEP